MTSRRSGACPRRAEAIASLGSSFKRAMVAVRRLRGRDTQRPGTPSFAQYQLLFALADRDGLSTRRARRRRRPLPRHRDSDARLARRAGARHAQPVELRPPDRHLLADRVGPRA